MKKLALIGFGDSMAMPGARSAPTWPSEPASELVANEKYARTDTTVVGQILKIIATNPDAVLIAASRRTGGAPAAAAARKRFCGQIYGTLGATFGDFRKLTGAQGDGTCVPLSPTVGASSFPTTIPPRRRARIHPAL